MKPTIPSDFILGIADSDLQVIGEKWTREEEHSEQTMWDTFCRSGKCFANTSTEIGVDRYHRFPEDIELMKKLGVRHYRTSISMARILRPDGRPHEHAIRWYENYFKLLKAAGIKIYVTLYHWELPQYLSEQGGWTNRRTIDYFLKHTALVADRLGEYIEEYFVLNEPWCSAFLGHFVGIHAPGEKNLKSALLATHNLLLAQGLAVRVLSHINPRPKIGTVTMVEPAYPATDSHNDKIAAQYADEHQNWWFLDPLFFGTYPQLLLNLYGESMPRIGVGDMEEIKIGHLLDDLGLNSYGGKRVEYREESPLKFDWAYKEGSEYNDLGWVSFTPPLYPEGLREIITQTYNRYKNAGLKRIMITENGFAEKTEWDGSSEVIEDNRRSKFLEEHLRQVLKAREEGVPVNGYFVWTLMDNFEWAQAHNPNGTFGLVHVDRPTLKRILKKSALWFQDISKSS